MQLPTLFAKKQRRATIMLLVLLVAVLVNIYQFSVLEDRIKGHWRAIHRWETSILTEQRGGKARYESFEAISKLAPGVTLYVSPHEGTSNPSRKPSYQQRAFGVGRISDMQIRTYDYETFLSDFNLDKHILAQGRNYVIAGVSAPIEDLVLTVRGDTLTYIDIRLLNTEQRRVLR